MHLSVPANGIEPQQSHCDDAESTIQLTANCRINQCLAARDPIEAHFQAAMHQYHLRRSIRSITCRFGSRCASSARMRYTCIQHQHYYKHYFKCIHIRSPSSFHRTPDLSLSPSLLLMLTCSSEVYCVRVYTVCLRGGGENREIKISQNSSVFYMSRLSS